MNILLDLNITIDLLIPKRKGHLIAEKLNAVIKERGYTKWVSASSVDNLQYTLLSMAKSERFSREDLLKIKIEFEKFLSEVKIFSTTGKSIREAINARDLEDHILYTNFKRISPDGIVISNDKDFKNYPDVVSPEEFFEKYAHTPCISSLTSHVPMLDLQEEYRYMLEDLDAAILKNVADAKYILGPQVKELEDKIAKYLGVKHCIGASSGTEALVLSLRALAIKLKGQEYFDKTDEIITTPFTFTATGDAILRAGATPVFVDIDPITYNIDPAKIREYLTQNSKLKTRNSTNVVGMIPVHLYGQPCNMDEIMEIAKEYNLFVLEDVAQAFGGVWNGKKLGAIGTAGTFSFFPSKNLGGFGDGGMVSTNDDELAALARMLLKHGGKDKYNVDHIGYNARLDTLQAAILLAKFKYIDEFNNRRRNIAEIYNKELSATKGIILPMSQEPSPISHEPTPISHEPSPMSHEPTAMSHELHHVFHQYTIRVLNGKRDSLQKHMKEKGIDTMVYYPVPLHKMKVFNGRCKIFDSMSESEKAVKEVLSLPMEPLMREKEVIMVAKTIKSFFK